ncbi:hypothetical protein C0J52_05647 [Blattella germanica]|nr:hypothetical protein C0J52_05647 [Blattella germanica]
MTGYELFPEDHKTVPTVDIVSVRKKPLDTFWDYAHMANFCVILDIIVLDLLIAKALREKHYSVFEEVHGVSDDGSTRRIDMIAFLDTNKDGSLTPSLEWNPMQTNQ